MQKEFADRRTETGEDSTVDGALVRETEDAGWSVQCVKCLCETTRECNGEARVKHGKWSLFKGYALL